MSQEMDQRRRQLLPPRGLGYRVKLLSQLMSRRFSEALESHGLTVMHYLVLSCLWQEDGLPTTQVGDRLVQMGGTLTGVIDRMETRGLVERRRDNMDRRVWRIWLTDAGRDLEAVLLPTIEALYNLLFGEFSAAERQVFSDLVDRLLARCASAEEQSLPALLAAHRERNAP
jgi:DNA-binding MarR family transcriptional regulator